MEHPSGTPCRLSDDRSLVRLSGQSSFQFAAGRSPGKCATQSCSRLQRFAGEHRYTSCVPLPRLIELPGWNGDVQCVQSSKFRIHRPVPARFALRTAYQAAEPELRNHRFYLPARRAPFDANFTSTGLLSVVWQIQHRDVQFIRDNAALHDGHIRCYRHDCSLDDGWVNPPR